MSANHDSPDFWDYGEEKEDLIHRIHSYPAKFPAFITTKALQYAERKGVEVKTIADVFCGCGTTAVEAKKNGKNFWGCDINPVATLIAQVKTRRYKKPILEKYFSSIIKAFVSINVDEAETARINSRIKYWFEEENIDALFRLNKAINQEIPNNSLYKKFFLCAFSNILKPTSKWLTKSIKAQIDPNKPHHDVMQAFEKQFALMIKANDEGAFSENDKANILITSRNFLSIQSKKYRADLIVTSPPYVTSYDYAEIHQLSALWLDYVTDYRNLRKNMVGNSYGIEVPSEFDIEHLPAPGGDIYKALYKEDKAKARATIRYFIDISKAVAKCQTILNQNGMIIFVMGNTEYRGVKIDNVAFLRNCMESCGLQGVEIIPRKMSMKALTPYRDSIGRFTKHAGQRRVYAKEAVLIGRKA
ncbi:MAG: DNA methyltransferase [Gammaproteobacteria bacterium]|nr:DNA methyltransferase [Gammaproteobacteria bacterium]